MSPQTYKEQDFEEHITEHLLNSDYYSQTPNNYDKDLCLIPSEVLQFIQTTQLEEYEKLTLQYGPETPQKLCYRLAREVDKSSVLPILNRPVG